MTNLIINFFLFSIFSQLCIAMDTKKTRVMLIEDTAFFQQVVTKSLEKCGFEVILATDSDDAIAKARDSIMQSRPVQAFLLDDNLGKGMNGLLTMKAIRKIQAYEHGLFILHSTNNETCWNEYQNSGATCFINKNSKFSIYADVIKHELGQLNL